MLLRLLGMYATPVRIFSCYTNIIYEQELISILDCSLIISEPKLVGAVKIYGKTFRIA